MTTKPSGTNTDTNEIFRNVGDEGDVPDEVIEGGGGGHYAFSHHLLSDVLGQDGRLGDVKVQTSIFFEDVLDIRSLL